MKNITELNLFEEGIIKSINCDLNLKSRLLALGFICGSKVKVLAISSLKKTFLLKVQDSVIAIKSSTLKDVYVCKK